MRRDYYELLDVSPKATAAEIKCSYRRLAMRFHPDRNAGNPAAEERFKLLVEAYRVLGDEESREDYDAWLLRAGRLAAAPELASMPRRVHLSPRRSRERREQRQDSRQHRRGGGRRPRPSVAAAAAAALPQMFLRRKSLRTHPLFYLLYCLCALSFILPVMCRSRVEPKSEKNPFAVPESENLPFETQRKNFMAYADALRLQAERGDSAAQYRYALLLYNGHGSAYGLPKNVAAARAWWVKAADAGYAPAAQMLLKMEASSNLRLPELPASSGGKAEGSADAAKLDAADERSAGEEPAAGEE